MMTINKTVNFLTASHLFGAVFLLLLGCKEDVFLLEEIGGVRSCMLADLYQLSEIMILRVY